MINFIEILNSNDQDFINFIEVETKDYMILDFDLLIDWYY